MERLPNQKRVKQRWLTCRFLILRIICLFFFLRTATIASTPTDGADNSLPQGKECFAHGCPFYPRDVIFDETASEALDVLSEPVQRKDAQAEQRALEELESCGNDDKATMTMIGNKGGSVNDQINQDRSFVLSPFRLQNLQIPNARMLGVFDGHSKKGELVSQYAVEQVPSRLSSKLQSYLTPEVLNDPELMEIEVKRAMDETFVEIDRDLPTKNEGGCTASVALQLGKKIYIANTGDSQTFVVAHLRSSGETRIMYVSREDKPDLPIERARIEKMGGRVNIPEGNEDSARAIVMDPNTGWWYGVAMSRSLGDWDITGVIPNPIVDVLDTSDIVASMINPESTCPNAALDDETSSESGHVQKTCTTPTNSDVEIFAVSATDGMMDFMTHELIAESLAAAFYAEERDAHPLTACNDLIMQAAKEWSDAYNGSYRDDIAIAACKLTLDTTQNS